MAEVLAPSVVESLEPTRLSPCPGVVLNRLANGRMLVWALIADPGVSRYPVRLG